MLAQGEGMRADTARRLTAVARELRNDGRVRFAYVLGGRADESPVPVAASTVAVYLDRRTDLAAARRDVVECVARHPGAARIGVAILNTTELEEAGRLLETHEVLMERHADERREFEFLASAVFEDFQASEQLFLRERAERPYADVITRKLAQLETHVARLRVFAALSPDEYAADWMRRCAIERTLELAIDACLGLARHTIAERRLRTPATYADTFAIARDAGLIDPVLAAALARMCGFRNVLAHEGEHVDAAVVVEVLRHHLDDLARAGELARGWMTTQG